jgi:Flp pilus assembly protein TadG
VSTRGRRTNIERGQAAVEFALVLPFLLVMLVGIIEFGRAWNEHQVITEAARAAARKAAVYDPSVTRDSVVRTAAATMLASGIDTTGLPSNWIDPDGPGASKAEGGWDGDPNTPVTVNIDLPYQFTFFGPLVNWATGQSNITLRTSVTMRNE